MGGAVTMPGGWAGALGLLDGLWALALTWGLARLHGELRELLRLADEIERELQADGGEGQRPLSDG